MEAVARAIRVASARMNGKAEVADALDMKESTLTRWADGSIKAPSGPKLIRLFELAHMSMDEAFGLSDREREMEQITEIAEVVAKKTVEEFTRNAILRGMIIGVKQTGTTIESEIVDSGPVDTAKVDKDNLHKDTVVISDNADDAIADSIDGLHLDGDEDQVKGVN